MTAPGLPAPLAAPRWTVPTIWAPCVLLALRRAVVHHGCALPAAVAAFAVGRLLWWLMEYAMHRWLFHCTPRGYWGITLHYCFHGIHHKHPNDCLRLVFPPLFATPLALLVWGLCHAMLPGRPGPACAVFAGMLTGYIVYDCLHHATHSWTLKSAWMARSEPLRSPYSARARAAQPRSPAASPPARPHSQLGVRRRHLAHHYHDSTTSFGVSSGLFDVVFRTLPRADLVAGGGAKWKAL